MILYNRLLKGFQSAFNLDGDTFELPEIKTDAENICTDWEVVGNLLRETALSASLEIKDGHLRFYKSDNQYATKTKI